MTMYSGDEFYGDDITSGVFDDERDAIEAEYDGLAGSFCDRCGESHTPSCAEKEWDDYKRRNPGPPRRVSGRAFR